MIPENDFKALSGMFADVEPKVEQAPEAQDVNDHDHPFTIGFKNGSSIRGLGKSFFIKDAIESMAQSMQGLGRAFRGSGGIVMLHDDFDELFQKLTTDADITRSRRIWEGHTIKRGTSEKEAFKTKTRGRLIGRKSW